MSNKKKNYVLYLVVRKHGKWSKYLNKYSCYVKYDIIIMFTVYSTDIICIVRNFK